MNFFCIQSTDQKFPLESSGFTSLLFGLSARTRFVQPSLLCTLPFVVNVVELEVVSYSGDVRCSQRQRLTCRLA